MLISERAYNRIQREVLVRHFDANETPFLERELTQLRAKVFEVQYVMPIARTLAPKATDIAPSASTYSYKVLDRTGQAKLINYKANDLPRVDVVAKEVLGKVVAIGCAFGWDLNELREAARTGTQLAEAKARAARDFVERAIDTILAFGSLPDSTGALPDLGMTGFANNSIVAGLGILSGTFWLNPTPPDPKLALADLNALVARVPNDSDNTFTVDTVLLPTKHYTYAEQTVYSTLTGETVLTIFKRNNPRITQIAPWPKLNTAGAGGLPRAIAYQKDPGVLELIIPQEFEVMPPEVQGLEFLNNCHARCGGTKVYQPMAVRYCDFATS